MHPLPLLSFHSYAEQRLNRTPILSPLLVSVVEGEKWLRIGEQEWRCPAGSWLALAGEQRVQLINRPGTHGSYQAWALGQQEGWQQRLHELFGAQLAGRDRNAPAQVFAPSEDARAAFARLLELLPLAERGGLRAAQAEHAWQGLMLALAEAGQGGVLLNRRRYPVRERILNLLRSDLSHDWQADAVSARLAMSPATLRRKLAGEGISFRRLLQDARMEHALGLVNASQRPLGEIAAACGYQSPSRFAAAFQRQFGCAPSSLRQMSGTG